MEKFAWAVGIVTFALVCFSKSGHRFLAEKGEGRLLKQVQLLFGIPLLASFFALLTAYAVVSGLGGVYVSLKGASLVLTGEIASKSFTTSRGCQYRAEIRWSQNSWTEKHCYSEELWTQMEVGQSVLQKRWQLSHVYAESDFAWPEAEIPSEVRQAELFKAWSGFAFLGGIFLIPVFSCLLFWFFGLGRKTST